MFENDNDEKHKIEQATSKQESSYLFADGGYLSLVHKCLRDDLGEGSAVEILHNDPELVILDHVAVEVVDHIGVLVAFHDEDLVDDKLLLGLHLEVHLLDGHSTTR